MSKRLLIGTACLFAAMFTVPVVWATNVTLQLYPLTGEMRLLNPGSTLFQFVFYEIQSPSGGLNGTTGVWTSISGTYDASGNGFVDPSNNWIKFSSTPTDLAEGVLFGPGGSLPADRSIGLGRIWDPNVASAAGLAATVSQGQTVVPMDKELAVDGDYTNDLIVDQQDYSAWSILFGTTNFTMADGNHNGVVDAADYTMWRDHLGARPMGPASEGGGPAIAAVPEPTSQVLFVVGSLAILTCRRAASSSSRTLARS